MIFVKSNWREFDAVVRAWRVARWASHAWGQIPLENLVELWNLSPSLGGFVEFLPGFAIAKGWVQEGPVGWGILAPAYCSAEGEGEWLRIWIGSRLQMRIDCYPDRTVAVYHHAPRWAEVVADGEGFLAASYTKSPEARDLARIARVLVVAYGLSDNSADAVIESLRSLAGGGEEFEKYVSMQGPEIFAGVDAF